MALTVVVNKCLIWGKNGILGKKKDPIITESFSFIGSGGWI